MVLLIVWPRLDHFKVAQVVVQRVAILVMALNAALRGSALHTLLVRPNPFKASP